MNIGFISTRLAGYDGVSLETDKWAVASKRLGHEVYYCAGELGPDAPPGMVVPEMHFAAPENVWICQRAYGNSSGHPRLFATIARQQQIIQEQLRRFIRHYAIDVLILQNVLAVPLQIPLALALQEVIGASGIATIAHNHDFYWERDCYQPTAVQPLLDSVFPIDLPSITHVVINSLAQRQLMVRRGIAAYVVPNVFDFDTPAPGIDDFNHDFRLQLGLADAAPLILSPVRIIPRKGLELGVELLARMSDVPCHYLLSHSEDLDQDYLAKIRRQAEAAGVTLLFLGERLGNRRSIRPGGKTYRLWDVYPHADFIFYPSLYEGFGNALLEAIYFRKPVLINRYPVYTADIKPLGFDFVEIEGQVNAQAVARIRKLLHHPEHCQTMGEHNYCLAQKHFSYRVLSSLLNELLRIARRRD